MEVRDVKIFFLEQEVVFVGLGRLINIIIIFVRSGLYVGIV